MAKKKSKQKGVSLSAFAAITTYADLMSLLLTLFVLLFALSEPKRPKLAATMQAIKQHLQRLPPPPPPAPAIRPQQSGQKELSALRRGPPGRRSEVTTLVEDDRQKLILGGEGLFQAGSSALTSKAKNSIQRDIVPDLRGFNNRIEVVGHAASPPDDGNNPWELAGGRAYAVMRYMVDECGIPEKRFRLINCGDTQPREIGNPAANRRVEIIMTEGLVKDP